MKKILIILLFSLIFQHAFPQNDVRVSYRMDAGRNITFYAVNHLKFPVYVAIELSYSIRSYANLESPIFKKVEPGSHDLFTIIKMLGENLPSIDYEYKYFYSNPVDRFISEYPYRLPVKQNEKVVVKNIRRFPNDRRIGFLIQNSNIVCAARDGVVIEIIDNSGYSFVKEGKGKLNYLEIAHNDGTIASYLNLKPESIKCKIGDKVEAGQEIAEASVFKDNKALLGFQLYHDKLDGKIQLLIPEFYLGGSIIRQIANGETLFTSHE